MKWLERRLLAPWKLAASRTTVPASSSLARASTATTSPVGLFLNRETPEVLADLAGNVWAWTRSAFKKRLFGRPEKRGAVSFMSLTTCAQPTGSGFFWTSKSTSSGSVASGNNFPDPFFLLSPVRKGGLQLRLTLENSRLTPRRVIPDLPVPVPHREPDRMIECPEKIRLGRPRRAARDRCGSHSPPTRISQRPSAATDPLNRSEEKRSSASLPYRQNRGIPQIERVRHAVAAEPTPAESRLLDART